MYGECRDDILSYHVGLTTAKATLYVKTDVEGRRLDKRTGLVTLVLWADNDECHI